MKKMLVKATGLLAVVSALLLASCSDGSEYDGREDTVLTLATPSVTAVAYPGVNLVSWNSIPNNDGYEIQRFEDDKFIDTFNSGNTFFSDNDIQNNVKYTYKVMARGNISSRLVVTSDSKQGSATVTGILPPASTSALNLAAYEGGYDGKKAKELSKSETEKGLKETAVVYNDKDAIRVTFNAKSYLNYGVFTSKKNTYDVTQVASVTADDDTVVNNSVLPLEATVTTAGTYKVYVKAVAKNSFFPTYDIVEVGSATYEALKGTITESTVSAAYINDGKTVRVAFTPAKESYETKAKTSSFKVYRNTFNTDLVAVAAPVEAISDDEFYVDDVIEDNTVAYTYTIVYTDGTKFGTTAPSKTVDAYALAKTDVSSLTITPNKKTLDTDNLANDITWTVAKTADQTVKAYLLTKDVAYTYTPKASDFDTTTALEAAETDNTDGTSVKFYTKNVAVGKAWLLVVVSEKNKADNYKISAAVEVKDATVSTPTLSVAKYDNTLTNASTGTAKKNDVIINVSDDITVASDSISNYTYTLYKAAATLKTDTTSVTFDITSGAKWEKVAAVEMKSNEVYHDDTTVTYVGVVKEENVADGTYAYKVVKTNKADVSETSAIKYVNIDITSTTIAYEPSISAAFDASDYDKVAKSDVTVQFTKAAALVPVYGTGVLASSIVDYEEVKAEEGVTYTLYKLVSDASQVAAVYEKVIGSFNPTSNPVGMPTYENDGGSPKLVTPEKKFVTSITYKQTLSAVSTGDTYKFIVVATKANAPVYVTNVATVNGKN